MRVSPWHAIALLGVVTTPLAAQRPHRTGLWAELCNGPSLVRIASSASTEVTTKTGFGSCFRVGGTLSNKVLLGVETFGFLDKTFGFGTRDTSVVAETGTIAVVVLWFPWRSGFFLKGGVGTGQGKFTVFPSPGQPVVAEGVGVGLTYGLGFDLPISRKFALTANAAAVVNAIGDLVLPTTRVEDVIATMYHVALGIAVR
jgi:hypothetical protein